MRRKLFKLVTIIACFLSFSFVSMLHAVSQEELPIYKVIVRSAPDSLAPISVSPADKDGKSDGKAIFTRKYYQGTVVTLTAAAQHSGKVFSHWRIDGVDDYSGRTIQVIMNDDHKIWAKYVTPTTFNLTVKSSPIPVTITVNPNDTNGNAGGVTEFSRVFIKDTLVTVSAPEVQDNYVFKNWYIDGAMDTNPVIQVNMDNHHVVEAIYELAVYKLIVRSAPDSRAPVTISPIDIDSKGNGYTIFTRKFYSGTVVTAIAPLEHSGKVFLKWQLDGVDYSTDPNIKVTMNSDHTIYAKYVSRNFTLTVKSSPDSGAPVTISPKDKNGLGNGNTEFKREYIDGTQVTATAPAEYNGKAFVKWKIDGADNLNMEISVVMNMNHTVEAIYQARQYKLDVLSLPTPGAYITITPNDKDGEGNGDANFDRVYVDGEHVTLTAAEEHDGKVFKKWIVDGSESKEKSIQVEMNSDHKVEAVYVAKIFELTVKSSPDSGAPVVVTPKDINNDGDGETEFHRFYTDGTVVTVTAPAQYNNKQFVNWLIDGVEDVESTIHVTMNEDHVVKAIYASCLHTLTVKSSPTNIDIEISPNDNGNAGDGTTEFDRVYNCGTTVTLKAPEANQCKYFIKWVVESTGQEYTDRIIEIEMDKDHVAHAYYGEACELGVDRERLIFGAEIAGAVTRPQSVLIGNSGGGKLKWSLSSDQDWIKYSVSYGTNSRYVSVSVVPDGLPAGQHKGFITVSGAGSDWGRKIEVDLNIYPQGSKKPSFGALLSPVDQSVVHRHIPVTGWVLDDIECSDVKIFYSPIESPKERVFLGNAEFVKDARPEIENEYPDYPRNYRCGWGYMLLTNLLPNDGNGTFVISVIATDILGNEMSLGSRIIICDNESTENPFGRIETPVTDSEISGTGYLNKGWALTALPNTIPQDGSSINVWIDGVMQNGHPQYDIYKGEVADRFEGLNNCEGAEGDYVLDSTRFCNGEHNIAWSVGDDSGNLAGIGSKFFTILNPGCEIEPPKSVFDGAVVDVAMSPVKYRTGYDLKKSLQSVYPESDGTVTIRIEEDERLELYFNNEVIAPDAQCNPDGNWYFGFHLVAGMYKKLPVGSSLNAEKGIFYWQPGAGYIGTYTLVLVERDVHCKMQQKKIRIIIDPKS